MINFLKKIVWLLSIIYFLFHIYGCKVARNEKDSVSLEILNKKIYLKQDTIDYIIKNNTNHKILIFTPPNHTFREEENFRKENPFRLKGEVFNIYDSITPIRIWAAEMSLDTRREVFEYNKKEKRIDDSILLNSKHSVRDTLLYLQTDFLKKRLKFLNSQEEYHGKIQIKLWTDLRLYFPSHDESYYMYPKEKVDSFRLVLSPVHYNLKKFLPKEFLDSLSTKGIDYLKDSLISNKIKIIYER